MKFVVDNKIPYIREALSEIGAETVYIDGSEISAEDVRDADALVVRTRTRCDERLLGGSRVRFVATATIGYDHIDTGYLARAGIHWTNCPGCNAASVAQYMRSVLLLLERDFGVTLSGMTIGVVGYGHVGRLVAGVARELGLRVLVCDPLVDISGKVSMDEVERQSDIISFHVPLTDAGLYPTRHLADAAFFTRLVRRPFIVNTSRGEVVDNEALLRALEAGSVRQAVIDTWEHEPHVCLPLLNKVYIGTPHIAGYSADGKVNADNMVIEALCRFFDLSLPRRIVPPALPQGFVYDGSPLQLYNPLEDSGRLKQRPEDFEKLRGNYPLRREIFAQ